MPATHARQVGRPLQRTVTARAQLSRRFPTSGLQPLPPGAPTRVSPDRVGITDPGSTLIFAVIGDHGGIEGAAGNAVSYGLQKVGIEWSFIWSVGDIV